MSICEQCVKLEDKFVDITIKQVAYLSQQKKFILLTQKNDVYFFLEDQKQIIQAMCSSKNNKKELLQFSQNSKSEKLEQLLSCPSGKYFYFSNGENCFMYDINGLEVREIRVNGKIKIFEDKSDIIIIDNITKIEQNNSVIVLANAIKQKTINKLGDEEKQIVGNPSLDIIKGSCIKFGPNSVFLSTSKKKQISFQIDKQRFSQIESYFNKINLNNNINLDVAKLQFSEISQQDLQSIMFSRVPLQLCTTENGILIPLFDGFRKETSTEQKVCVYEKSKQLRLGFIEEFLINNQTNIFVIGIIGKQSSGKSYLLNRVFGTRFSVSSARCTDGIWASIGWIEGQKFLILDCEGLFNSARTNQEEVQMLAFLTAICDISILNSDITFNRYMNDLFNNLTNASSQLKGETLFKGQLHIALRDVSSTDNSGIDNELLTNLYRLKSQDSQDIVFLKKLFNNNFTVEKLFNFEHQQFDEQIINLRQYFSKRAQTSKRWEDGRKLVQMMKILLCQLELSDHGNANLIDIKLQVEKIIENQIKLWHQFSINQPQNCKLAQQEYEFPENSEEIIFFNSSLLKQVQKDLHLNNTILNHNENLNQMENEIQKLMIQRKEYILEQTKQELQKYQQPEIIEIKSKEEGLLTIYINNQIQQYQFCKEKCSHCYLQCNQFKNHIKEQEKLITTLQEQQKTLEKEIAETSIKTDDESQQIQQRLIQISEELQELDINISQKEQLQRKEKIYSKIIKQNLKLQQFSFCDTQKKQVILENLDLKQIQNQKFSVDLTAENLDKIINEIKSSQEKKNQQLEENLIVLEQIQNDIKIKEKLIKDIQNEIQMKQDNHAKQSLQKDELENTLAHQQNELNIIKQDQQKLEQTLLQWVDFKIENHKLIEQQKQIEARFLDEEKKECNIKRQITILEQKLNDFQQQKLTIYKETELFEEQKEIRNEKDMLLKVLNDLQKQIDKIDKLRSIKQLFPNVSAIQTKEKSKLESELKITIDSDLDLKQKEIEETKSAYQEQLKKQKFEDLEILEQIYNEQKETTSNQSQLEKIVYQRYVTHKQQEKKDLIEELENLKENAQKNQQNMNQLKIVSENLSIYQKLQNQQKQTENFMNEIKDQLIKINNNKRTNYNKIINNKLNKLNFLKITTTLQKLTNKQNNHKKI
ncbi:unnamed protein product (macronuclear) [Paramecium tetraurelia]|uniref:VLIG-type G domain-containing protein n=1 Tax=Paramecium tetraurelia TaxID=5888 RepID=A0E3A8_PARTE|nr:uncharacterized protein GSPATT00022948001 [Paramecium tetraurelia]CAK89775.1 unnamed protein product [Paramecium tetraurelia]|eukprot:XP_001457172.1 hypothetical protein (macronuclear) [Paramecium tetraurelia strain d4-2]